MLSKNLKNEETKNFAFNLRYYNGYEKSLGNSMEIRQNIINVSKLRGFERPDMYIELEDEIIGIEQFEFSSYTINKKGNTIKRKLNLIEQENLKNRDFSKDNDYFLTYVETDISKENYEKNFIKVFESHYKNIKEYKKNLRNKFCSNKEKNIKIYFLICDETVDGTGVINKNGEYEFYIPAMNKKILEFLAEHSEVYGIIFQCSCVYNKKLFYYLKNNKENIEFLLQEYKDYFDLELVKENFTNVESYWRL